MKSDPTDSQDMAPQQGPRATIARADETITAVNDSLRRNAEFPTIPGFTFRRVLGEGGPSVVYEVKTEVGQVVALKMLKPLAVNRESRERFRQEAEAMARLKHRHVVTLFGWGEHDDWPYFTMPVYGGGTLAKQLKWFQESPQRAVAVLAKIADAVQYLHGRGAVHRDLKPHNVLLDDDREPYLSDFGLLKLMDGQSDFSVTPVERSLVGAVVGTPAYMDPQQAAGENRAVGRLWDVWSLGVMLFELLTRQRPFAAADQVSLLQVVQTQEAPLPRSLNPELDPELERIILKCLARDPALRFQSAGQLAAELRQWLQRHTTPKGWPRRHGVALVLGVVLLCGAMGGLVASRSTSSTTTLSNLFVVDVRTPETKPAAPPAIAADKLTSLLGETGKPEWFHVPVGKRWLHVHDDPHDGVFTIDTQSAVLIELTPKVPLKSYRFQVQARQNNTARDLRAGLYCGRAEHPEISGHLFFEWSFAAPDEATQRRNIAKNLPDDQVWGIRDINLHSCTDDGITLRSAHYDSWDNEVPFSRRALRPAPWWDLAVEVRPDEYAFFWNGEKVATRRATVARDDEFDIRRFFKLMPDAKLATASGGGLGLYLSRGSASFRSAAIIPLP